MFEISPSSPVLGAARWLLMVSVTAVMVGSGCGSGTIGEGEHRVTDAGPAGDAEGRPDLDAPIDSRDDVAPIDVAADLHGDPGDVLAADADAPPDAEDDVTADADAGDPTRASCWSDVPELSSGALWVAPTGDDTWEGTEGRPFATVARASAAVREIKAASGLPVGGLTVVIRQGDYRLGETWTLGPEDSGEVDRPVTYRSYPGEVVRITGDAPLSAGWFEPLGASDPMRARLSAAAAEAVEVVDLSAHGITDLGHKEVRGMGAHNASWSLELVVDDQPMELARWPNRGQSDPVDPEADAVLSGDIFGVETPMSYLGTSAVDNADDGYPNYEGTADGRTWYLYHCTWEWGGGTHRYWWVTETDPRVSGNCWPSSEQAWGGSGSDLIPVLTVHFGSASEDLIARNRPEDIATDGFVRIPEVSGDQRLRLPGSRHARWVEPTGLWVQGLFYNYWADTSVSATLDTGGWVDLAEEPAYGLRQLQPMAVFNVFEELDEPGEYFVDAASGRLYFWPDRSLDAARLEVTMLDGPLLEADGLSHVNFEGIDFTGSRASLVRATGVEAVRFSRSRLSAAAGDAVLLRGASSGLDCCEIAHVGGQGIGLVGGHRASLEPSHDFVTRSEIHDFGRWDRTYHVGIRASGCGHRIANNRIHHAPHTAILFSGNAHSILLNEIDHVVHEANDAGAIYTGRDWGYRGTLIRHNYIHDIDSVFGGAHGVYLDDASSGMDVSGNLFANIHGHATVSGGGRDNLFHHNIMVHLDQAGHTSDRRARTTNDTPGDSWNLVQRLQESFESYEHGVALDHQAEPWASAFPRLAVMPDDFASVVDTHWLDPEGCMFSNNLVWDSQGLFVSGSWGGEGAEDFYEVSGNVTEQDPLFVDEAGGDLNLRADSPAWEIAGFEAIPFDDIGLRNQ